jgi:hypothetical protein
MWPTRLFAALSPDEARNRVASVSVDTAPRRCRWSSSPEELHLQALTEPCLKVSPYTALRGVESAPSREHPVSGGQRFLLVAQLTKAAIEPRHPLRSPPITEASTLLPDDPPSHAAFLLSISRVSLIGFRLASA